MIPARFRLRTTKDIDLVYRRGRRIAAPHFFLFVVKSADSTFRVAAVISKKVAKKAVDRNRVRRQIMAIIRTQLPNIATELPFLMLVSAKKDAHTLEFSVMEREIQELLTRAASNHPDTRRPWRRRPSKKH